MSYIQPNSRIEFFDDIGISQDYNDTLYFPTVTAKDTYFSNIDRLAHVDRCYYARDNRGYVRVELPMNTLIHSQYMRFKNTSYENKWWYAFVTNVIYINDNTTEVQFELDPIMTWMGEFTISPCFVERQHSEVDYIGSNVVPESINISEPVIRTRTVSSVCGNYGIVIFMSHKNCQWIDQGENWALYRPQMVGGVYNGVDMIYCGSPAVVEYTIGVITTENWIDDIIGIKMLPMNFKPLSSSVGSIITQTISRTKPYSDISGYSNVRNKKLFTYPYNYVSISNSEGQSNIYKYELFGQVPPNQNNYPNYNFSAKGAWNMDMEVILAPDNYNGNLGSPTYEDQLAMHDFPSCAWNVDTYKAMMAQKESSLPTRLLASSMSTYAASQLRPITTRHAMSIQATNAASDISDLLANAILPPNMPTIVRGSQGSNMLIGVGQKDFIVTEYNINAYDAKIVDDYFTMFGYADRTVHVPNMNARQRFTYVKTIGCKINCRCPASDADFIENLFNRGIRFWKNHTQIGNYTDDNLPIA